MLDTLLIVIAGYSVVALAILFSAYVFFLPDAPKTTVGVISCFALSGALIGLQLMHLDHFVDGNELFERLGYVALLFTTPPAFYFFSRTILMTDAPHSWAHLLHLGPILVSAFIPEPFVGPIAFTIGAAYSLWFANVVYGMRRHIRRFRFELFFFGLFAVMAVAVLILVLLVPFLASSIFYAGYAASIGVAVALISSALLVFPEIVSDVSATARLAYANSTLKGLDVEGTAEKLERLLESEKPHRDERLNLGMLAEAMDLTSHQLSELINTHFGIGFSRLIRERRVADAKQQLREDQRASVLSIGLAVGFGSQSSFYAAFREVTGESPASYRKTISGPGESPK